MRLFVAALLALVLMACQKTMPLHTAVAHTLSGHVTWPTGGRWHTAATLTDLQTNGTVVLTDPVSRAVVLSTTASGPGGTFTLAFASALPPGYYWLDAIRFMRGDSNAGITLKTIVEYTGGDWRSISGATVGDPVLISPLTTAVARLRALDGTLTDSDTMGIVIPGNPAPTAMGSYSSATIALLADEVNTAVTFNGDGAGDLNLPVSVLPAAGTPGLTKLTWTGLPNRIEPIQQIATGKDALTVDQTLVTGAVLTTGVWNSRVPAALRTNIVLRMLISGVQTLSVPWTANTPAGIRAADTGNVSVGVGPAGPQFVCRDTVSGDLIATPLGTTGPGAPETITNGGTQTAVTSTSPTTRHVFSIVAGALLQSINTGSGWSVPVAVPVAGLNAAGTGPTVSQVQAAPDGAGGLWCGWIEGTTLTVAHYDGATWGAAETVVTAVAVSFVLAGGTDPRVTYRAQVSGLNHVLYSQRTAGSWPAPTLLSSGEDTTSVTMAVSASGKTSVVWCTNIPVAAGETQKDLVFRYFHDGIWETEEQLFVNSVAMAQQPQITFDPSEIPVVFWLDGDFRPIVRFCRRSDVASAIGIWSPPETLDHTSANGLFLIPGASQDWLLWSCPPVAPATVTTLRGMPIVW